MGPVHKETKTTLQVNLDRFPAYLPGKEDIMLRSQFEEELDKLLNQFYAMGNEVLGQINKTVRAFITHDRQLAKEIIEADAKINEFELKLEQKSLEIIALQQPVSADLRAVILC